MGDLRTDMARDFEEAAASEPEQRTQYLLEAAQTWRTIGDYQRAHDLFAQLLDEDSPESGRVRVEYAAMLVDLGNREHAVVLLTEVWNTTQLDPEDALIAGQIHKVSLQEPERAARWFERGISNMLTLGSSPTAEEVGSNRVLLDLFHSRRRARDTLQKPDDDWDQLAQAGQQSATWTEREEIDELAEFDELLFGPEPRQHEAWLYWPLQAFAAYQRRWMHYDPDPPVIVHAHIRHRRALEGQFRSPESELPQVLVFGDVERFAEFVSTYGLNPISPETHAEYATIQADEDDVVHWAPAPDDRCWCVSGRRYRRCCGHPNFLA